jgi:hypothetical protein
MSSRSSYTGKNYNRASGQKLVDSVLIKYMPKDEFAKYKKQQTEIYGGQGVTDYQSIMDQISRGE